MTRIFHSSDVGFWIPLDFSMGRKRPSFLGAWAQEVTLCLNDLSPCGEPFLVGTANPTGCPGNVCLDEVIRRHVLSALD